MKNRLTEHPPISIKNNCELHEEKTLDPTSSTKDNAFWVFHNGESSRGVGCPSSTNCKNPATGVIDHVHDSSETSPFTIMVGKHYLCAAPRQECWDEKLEALLKSLGGDERKRAKAIRRTLKALRDHQ